MTAFLTLKWLHVLSGSILFGTGLGIAFFKWITDRSGDVRAIRIICERTVLADWVFTTPAVVVQPITGLALVHLMGYPLSTRWIVLAMLLYLFAGACWVPVVWIQIRMRELARIADRDGLALSQLYWQLNRAWIALGVPAFSALVVVYWLMVAKPAL